MTASVEQIKKEIRNLAPEEVDHLLRDLQREYVMPSPNEDDASVEAAWDVEINRRAQEVMNGTVELISGDDFDRHIDQLFAKHGRVRISHT